MTLRPEEELVGFLLPAHERFKLPLVHLIASGEIWFAQAQAEGEEKSVITHACPLIPAVLGEELAECLDRQTLLGKNIHEIAHTMVAGTILDGLIQPFICIIAHRHLNGFSASDMLDHLLLPEGFMEVIDDFLREREGEGIWVHFIEIRHDRSVLHSLKQALSKRKAD